MWGSGMWLSGTSGAGASVIADGAMLAGDLIVPSGADIIIQDGGHLSIASQNPSGGAIASPCIRAGAEPDDGLAHNGTTDQFEVIKNGVPVPLGGIEVLTGQSITAVGNTISHGTYAPIAIKTITPDANRTLTSNPCIEAGKYDGQLLILRGGGSFTTTLPNGNGTAFAGAANKAIGSGDYIVLRWAQSLTRWEQIVAVVDL